MTTVGFHARLDPELHTSVRDAADGLGVSMNEFICTILAAYVRDDIYVLKLRVIETPDGWLQYEMEIPSGLHDRTGMVDGERTTGPG